MGHVLAVDAKRTLDNNPMDFLQPLSSCEIEKRMDGKTFGGFRDHRFCGNTFYVSWREPFNEELAYVLKGGLLWT